MKKIILFILVSILSIFMISATVTLNSPSQVNKDSNFYINLAGSSLYAIELKIPSSFTIVSDPSQGILTNGTYRTSYASNLQITLRANTLGNYNIIGTYTDGNGVYNFNQLNILVIDSNSVASCPICSPDSAWSNCNSGMQIKQVYSCSKDTNYICKSTTVSQICSGNNTVCSDPDSCINSNSQTDNSKPDNNLIFWIIGIIAVLLIIVIFGVIIYFYIL